jgi:hypothetical protein
MSDQETDILRLNDLAEQHGLTFKRVGRLYIFDDFTAHGLRQALGYVEGFDRGRDTRQHHAITQIG